MTRRDVLKTAAAGSLAAATSLSAEAAGPPAAKPNIIFMMADDLGYGDLGCYGQKVIRTPCIDALAAEGTRFTQCYAGSTVCAPARSVLMTGQHTGHTTVRGNFGIGGRVPLRAEDVTVAEALKRAGYVTGITGKWGLGEPGTTGVPNKQGFDEWFGYLNQRNAHSYYPPYLWRNERKMPLPGNAGKKKGQYTHDMFTAFALDFIRRHARRNRPFFLYLPWTIPHAKYEIPSTDPYSEEPWKPNEKVHAAMVTRMDAHVGKIMALLKSLGIDERTIVLFCSDNGAANRWEGRFDSSGPLRGRKRDMYEGGIRTPMIVRWPGKVPAGAVRDTVWTFADFLPTAAAVAGARPPEGIDGVSVAPTLLGKTQRELETCDRFLYWEFFEGGFKQAVRWRNYKAVRQGPGRLLELYDLAADPGEARNIAADTPAVVARIEAYLKTARTESPHWSIKKTKPRKP